MTCTNPNLEARINQRLQHIHQRLEQIAAIEASAAWVGGKGSKGEFDPERQRLIEETERLLGELEAIGGSPKYHPKP